MNTIRRVQGLRTMAVLWQVLVAAALSIGAEGPVRGQDVRAALGEAADRLTRYHALIIGINNYQNWPDLLYPRDDARKLAQMLREQYGFDEVRLLLDEQATRKSILTELQSFLKLDENNSLFIYYAGHGIFDPELREGYWVPAEAARDSTPDYVPNVIIQQYVERMKARHVLIVADACFSGSLLRGDEDRLPQSLDSAWYHKMLVRPSRYVITSGDMESVPDKSVFSTKLLASLSYWETPVVSAKELALKLEKEVPQFSKQTVLSGRIKADARDEGGQFLFVRRTGAMGSIIVDQPVEPPRRQPQVGALSPGKPFTLDLGGNERMEFVYVAPGTFMMGANDGDDDEKPAHRMTVERGFWIGRTEVTEGQWQQVMGMTLSGTGDSRNPVEAVSWNDAQAFCKRLNERYLAGTGVFRLPAESEWERACRGETAGRFWFEGGIAQLGRHAWYSRNASGHPHPVGGLTPNSLGLCDMLGNVWEWCDDWYGPYPGADSANPLMGQQLRVLRGGSFANHSSMMSCSSRSGTAPDAREKGVGFRVAVEAK